MKEKANKFRFDLLHDVHYDSEGNALIPSIEEEHGFSDEWDEWDEDEENEWDDG